MSSELNSALVAAVKTATRLMAAYAKYQERQNQYNGIA